LLILSTVLVIVLLYFQKILWKSYRKLAKVLTKVSRSAIKSQLINGEQTGKSKILQKVSQSAISEQRKHKQGRQRNFREISGFVFLAIWLKFSEIR
jgi:hypothetical protein